MRRHHLVHALLVVAAAALVANVTQAAEVTETIPAGDYAVAKDVNWQAKWIWTDGPSSPRNLYLLVVKDVQVGDPSGEWRCHVSADSRYRFFVNGEWMGNGPARCFAFNQEFDTYDLTGLLVPGKNRLTVLVSHYGEGTFQYNPTGQAGALAQLERKKGGRWQVVAATDETWKVRRHAGYIRPTTRISCQMPFEEIFDARPVGAEILSAGEGSGFAEAKTVAAVGEGPWKRLVPRHVPMFTRELVPPVRVVRTRTVEVPNWFSGLTLRPYLLPGYFMQNHKHLNGVAVTVLVSPTEQKARFYSPMGRFENLIINGKQTHNGKPVMLEKGENLCMIACRAGTHHTFDRCYVAHLEKPVTMKGVFDDQTAWTVIGPIKDYRRERGKLARATCAKDLSAWRDAAQPVKQEHIVTAGSPWTETRFVDDLGQTPRIDRLESLCCSSPETTVIHPTKEGHPEILLDFGKEVVGELTFDIVGPAGVAIDFNCFEEIEDGERFHYTEGNLSALRYITREGRQQYTSFLRRGYRYCQVTFRNVTAPVRVRSIHTVFSTSPPVERSSFACSDPLLNTIWHIGRHTLRCCAEDTFTDCPTYEQTYWVGDGRNEAMIDYAAFGDIALTRRCAELPGQSLFRQLIPESQVPSAWDRILTAWALLWVQMVDEHYGFSGDMEYLRGVYPDVRKTLRNIKNNLMDDRGLMKINAWNMFDWAGQDSGHDVVTHNQMFLVEALRRGEFLARELGKKADAAGFAQQREDLIAAINKHLWDEDKGAYIDSIHNDGKRSGTISQQTNSLAVAYDVAPADRLGRIQDVPVRPKSGMVKVGSPFALFYILEALAKQGRQAEILAIVRDRWGLMVDKGATTFWETFPGYNKDWWTRSYCHAWSAAPTYFLTRYQLGVWWADPGCDVVRIAPKPVDLTWARGRWHTPHGSVEVSWEKDAEQLVLDVDLPDGVRGIVELPGEASDYASVSAKTGTPVKKDGTWRLNLPAGAASKITARRPG